MKTYYNYIIINGQTFTHSIKANNIKEAYQINKERKLKAKQRGRTIKGRLTL